MFGTSKGGQGQESHLTREECWPRRGRVVVERKDGEGVEASAPLSRCRLLGLSSRTPPRASSASNPVHDRKLNSRALMSFNAPPPIPADSYAAFASSDFDAKEYANAILAGEPFRAQTSTLKPTRVDLEVGKEDISVAISKLNLGIEDVSKQIKSVVGPPSLNFPRVAGSAVAFVGRCPSRVFRIALSASPTLASLNSSPELTSVKGHCAS